MNPHSHNSHSDADRHFSTAVAGLPKAIDTAVLDLADGDTIDMRIAPVVKRLGEAEVRMLAYNGSVPGPSLRVREGSALVVNVANDADLDATVHWHGLRLDAPPDKTLGLVAVMDMGVPEGPVMYACPMHPEVVSEKPARCPKCWMKLIATAAPTRYACPMHPEVVSEKPNRCPKCGMKLLPAPLAAQAAEQRERGHDGHGHEHANPGEAGRHGPQHQHGTADGIEWEDDMVDVNRITTPANMH